MYFTCFDVYLWQIQIYCYKTTQATDTLHKVRKHIFFCPIKYEPHQKTFQTQVADFDELFTLLHVQVLLYSVPVLRKLMSSDLSLM